MPAPFLPVPHHRQHHQADCLVACAAMVLEYLGIHIVYRDLLRLLNIVSDLGAPASNIHQLTMLGVSVDYGTTTLERIADYIAQGNPCITFVDTIHLSYWKQTTHYAVVVVGINSKQVYVHDPYFNIAPQQVSRLEFALAWDEMDNTYAKIKR